MKRFNQHHRSAERLSQRVFYLLIVLTAVLFGLYYLIGYDRPYVENPDFNEPLLTSVLLAFMYVLLGVAMGVGAWALWREMRRRQGEPRYTNGIRTALISRCVAGGTLLVLILTFVFGSTQPVVTNGKNFTDALLLRVADQFIHTSVILLIVAVAAAGYGMTRYYRKPSQNHAD